MPELSLPISLIVASAILFAPLASWLALRRERSWAAWFLFGVALGPIATGLLVVAPPGRCPVCGNRSHGWPRRCASCGLVFASIRSAPARVEEPAPAEAPAPTELDPAPRPRPGTPSATRATKERKAARSGDLPSQRPATSFGRRPALAPIVEPAVATAARESPGPSLSILCSAIYVGGSEPLQIGSRYLLARLDNHLQILGPLHLSPAAVAARVELSEIEATVVGDRLLITGSAAISSVTLAFSRVGVETGVDLEVELRPVAGPSVVL